MLAAAPGGRFAPELARLARADRALSVEITLFLFKLVPFTAPFVVKRLLGAHHRVELHELAFIARLLALQVLPYLLGKLVRRRRGNLANGLVRPVRIVSTVCLIGIVAFVLLHRDLSALWLLRGGDWLAILLCGAASLVLGWASGGRAPAVRRTFALSANSRNLALALLIASLAIPDGDVQLAVFAVWAVFTGSSWAFAMLARYRAQPIAARGVPV